MDDFDFVRRREGYKKHLRRRKNQKRFESRTKARATGWVRDKSMPSGINAITTWSGYIVDREKGYLIRLSKLKPIKDISKYYSKARRKTFNRLSRDPEYDISYMHNSAYRKFLGASTWKCL